MDHYNTTEKTLCGSILYAPNIAHGCQVAVWNVQAKGEWWIPLALLVHQHHLNERTHKVWVAHIRHIRQLDALESCWLKHLLTAPECVSQPQWNHTLYWNWWHKEGHNLSKNLSYWLGLTFQEHNLKEPVSHNRSNYILLVSSKASHIHL